MDNTSLLLRSLVLIIPTTKMLHILLECRILLKSCMNEAFDIIYDMFSWVFFFKLVVTKENTGGIFRSGKLI